MKVKICGIMDVETALVAVKAGADALGFVFAESKRKVSRKQVREIIGVLPENVLKVGVFVNERAEVIQEIIEETGLSAVQLHGDESAEYSQIFSVPVIKAFSISSEEDLKKIKEYPCEYVLLDSPKGKYRGGNGIRFDWRILENFSHSKKLLLAGGLDAANVQEAIQMANPYMVDVSSGVETNGRKDFEKIRNFIERAKSGEEDR